MAMLDNEADGSKTVSAASGWACTVHTAGPAVRPVVQGHGIGLVSYSSLSQPFQSPKPSLSLGNR